MSADGKLQQDATAHGAGCADPRAALAEAFFAVFLADWREGGEAAIKAMRTEKPSDYVKLAAALLPKDLAVKTEPIDELTNAEMAARIASLTTQIEEDRRAAEPEGSAGATGEADRA